MLSLHKNSADVFVPDGKPLGSALERTTHLSILAHQDDTELAALPAILHCFQKDDQWLTSVIVTNGAGSARTGVYEKYSNEEMITVRRQEQRKAAVVGEYSLQVQLDYASKEVKDSSNKNVVSDLITILEQTKPEVLYLHNPIDKHGTHVACTVKAIEAIRQLPKEDRPKKVYGTEDWRDLDWLCDEDKVLLDCSDKSNLSMALIGIFDSQISGGKRYDLASQARRKAHATYNSSHDIDTYEELLYAVDLTPLIEDDTLSLETFCLSLIDKFKQEVKGLLKSVSGS